MKTAKRRLALRARKSGKPATRASQARHEAQTTLLNVDLDIWSSVPLDRLVASFGRRVLVLHVGKEGRRYGAHLELAHSTDSDDADRMIQKFVRLVRRLPPARRALWNRAQRRDFNVGVQAGAGPFSYELPLRHATIRAIAGLNARVVFTVYGSDIAQ